MRSDLIGSFSEDAIREVERGVDRVVADAIEFGANSPYPSQDELFKDVYHE
jgi:TPP-dependent pyruvate/acetoin dehydrogenase alpha subunit